MTFGISIFSYHGTVRIGVSTDAATIPDPEALVAGFQDELQVLSAAVAQAV
jgi:hypothetical protein